MNPVQELIDVHMSEMPTGLAKQLLEACRDEYERTKLYRVTFTRVKSFAYVDDCEPHCKLMTSEHSLIVETITAEEMMMTTGLCTDLLDKSIILEMWVQEDFPFTLHHGVDPADAVTIIHSIVPHIVRRR